jgi:hypothetical protein
MKTGLLKSGRIIIMKMYIFPNAIYRFNAIPLQSTNNILHMNRKTMDIIWNHKILQITKYSRQKMNRTKGIMIPDLKVYYKAIVAPKARY